MNPAPLPGGAEHAGDSVAHRYMQIEGMAEFTPLAINGYGRLALLEVSRIKPQIRPLTLERTAEEGVDPLVDVVAQLRDLALGDAGGAHRLRQFLDPARRYAADPRLNKDVKRRADIVGIIPNEPSITRLIGARLQEGRKIQPWRAGRHERPRRPASRLSSHA
jgi:hypothetical protein